MIAALGLLSLVVVLFPSHTEPLWDWGKTVGYALGRDPLPNFDSAQNFAGLTLAAFVLCGLGYNAWRDRRFDVMRAEYSFHTGANHLKTKVHELEERMAETLDERNRLQESLDTLQKAHTAALIASKEHEVRSKYGQEDRDTLREMRAQFEELLRTKGHTEGFREAIQFMMANYYEPTDSSGFPRELAGTQTAKRESLSPSQKTALPFGK
jgi:hypothetical protein